MPEDFFSKGISSIIILIIATGLLLFWISMIMHCLKRSFSRTIYKVLWFFLIIIFQSLGALAYWLVFIVIPKRK